MEADDEAPENRIAESDDGSSAPRRATFLPPSKTPPPADSAADWYDDDALANAMADEAMRLGLTGAISIVPPQVAAPGVADAVAADTVAADTAVPPRPEAPAAPEVAAAPATVERGAPSALADLPAPSGPPVVFEGEQHPTAAPVPSLLPTRRSIRDAEYARIREENARRIGHRGGGPAAPVEPEQAPPAARGATGVPQEGDAAPDPEATSSPDFSPAPSAPDSTGIPGGASATAMTAGGAAEPTDVDHVESLFDGDDEARADVPAPTSEPPVYELIEPVGRSASIASVFPFAFASHEASPPSPSGDPDTSAAGAPVVDAGPATGAEDVLVAGISAAAGTDVAAADAAGTDVAAGAGAGVAAGADVAAGTDGAGGADGTGGAGVGHDALEPRSDDGGLPPRSATNPWLLSAAATAVVEVVPIAQPLFVPESSAAEPTPLDHRIGRASRLFWLWFAANSSVVSLAFGGALFSLGMSLRQAIVSVFVGVAISFLPLGLGTLAGKWSGQPVMIASRATFGLVGNVVPALIALITRLFWGAVLLWMVAAATARIVVGAKLAGPLSELQLTLIVMAVGFLLALGVAFFGYALVARVQLVLSILSAVLVVALVAVTWRAVDFAKALTVADGPVILVVTGVVLVFSFVGLVWANSSGDLARYQAAGTSGGASMLWASFGATLPAFLLIGYGAVLAASNPDTATGLASTPIDTIAGLLPGWYPLPLIAATALSLLSGVVLSIYSGGFALGATGVRVSRGWATVIVGALVFAIAIALGFGVSNVVTVFRDLATTLAVPVGAWAGLFAAEMIIRRRRFDTASLLARGGVYPDVNWVNLSMLVVSSIIGLGFTTASIRGLGWEGYLFRALGVPLTSDLAGTDVGVLFALLLGLLTPLVAGIPTIRRQERGHA